MLFYVCFTGTQLSRVSFIREWEWPVVLADCAESEETDEGDSLINVGTSEPITRSINPGVSRTIAPVVPWLTAQGWLLGESQYHLMDVSNMGWFCWQWRRRERFYCGVRPLWKWPVHQPPRRCPSGNSETMAWMIRDSDKASLDHLTTT